MRVSRLPAVQSEKLVVWQHIDNVSYQAHGTLRWLILHYENGATVNLEPHQARDLWYDVEQHKGCRAPCYFRHELDSAPPSCKDCLLAQALEGVEVTVRPAPLPPRRLRPADSRSAIIAILLLTNALVLWDLILTTNALQEAQRSPTLPRKVSAGDTIIRKAETERRVGEGSER